MPARTPRRSFATPFVVTLATAPACYVQSSPAPAQPQPAPVVAQQPEPRPTPSPIMNPPRPQPDATPTPARPIPTPMSDAPARPTPGPIVNPPRPQPVTQVPAGQTWTLYKQADGTCMAGIQVQCQPKATCNPPPPFKVACPPNVDLSASVTVVSGDDGTCHVQPAPMSCRPGISCNPPRPQPVACPSRP